MTHPSRRQELTAIAELAIEDLYEADPQIADLLLEEHRYHTHALNLLAASSPSDASTAIAGGISFPVVTAEGYPRRRFHSGAKNADALEDLAVERAKSVFSARHANVQPHSGSSANLAVLFSVLNPGDTILGLHLDSGGHLTHGASASITGKYFRTAHYGVDAYQVKICWVYLDRVKRWTQAITPDGELTRALTAGESPFDTFPHYDTSGEQTATPIDLDRERVIALTNLAAWSVLQRAELLAGELPTADLALPEK